MNMFLLPYMRPCSVSENTTFKRMRLTQPTAFLRENTTRTNYLCVFQRMYVWIVGISDSVFEIKIDYAIISKNLNGILSNWLWILFKYIKYTRNVAYI